MNHIGSVCLQCILTLPIYKKVWDVVWYTQFMANGVPDCPFGRISGPPIPCPLPFLVFCSIWSSTPSPRPQFVLIEPQWGLLALSTSDTVLFISHRRRHPAPVYETFCQRTRSVMNTNHVEVCSNVCAIFKHHFFVPQ